MGINSINDDAKTAQEGRKNAFSEEELKLDNNTKLVERSVKKLYKKLVEENFGSAVTALWVQANGDRAKWLQRQQAYLEQVDEFIDPIIEAPAEWASDLHLPVILTIGKTFHARFYSAILGQEPYCNVKARVAANEGDRANLVQDLIQYTMKSWVNDYDGIEREIDSFIWNWAFRGVGLLKMSWDKRYSRIVDVVKKPRKVTKFVVSPEGQQLPVEAIEFDDVEEETVVEDFNGPKIKRVAPEDFVIIGGDGDVDQADAVIESAWLTASDLWTLVDQGIFDKDVVAEVIEAGDNPKTGEVSSGIKLQQTENSGAAMVDKTFDLNRYQILECYIKKDVDGSGINTEIVCWVHKKTSKILRATYLHRINRKTKKRPYAKADFYIREGQTYGIGLVELTYSICQEIDALNNMAIDFGLLSSMPFGYYRQSSSLTQTSIAVEPGRLIPVDDPGSIFFPQLGARHAFPMQQLQFLYSIIEKLTGISDLNFGVIGGQGAARTASGVQAIMQESNNNLDIFLRRLNRAMKKVFKYSFAMVQEKMPAGLEFRVMGQDGNSYFRQIKSKEEVAGEYDFEFEPNSANSNSGIRMQTAAEVMQLTGNPLDIQLGIITPLQRFEALKNYLVAKGVKDYGRFIQKPQGMDRNFTPEELVNRILAGVDTPISMNMDLPGFMEYAQQIMSDDLLLGQFNEQQAIALAQKVKEAERMQQALQQMQAQQSNAQQMQANAAQSQQQTMQNAGAGQAQQAAQQAPPPEGGA